MRLSVPRSIFGQLLAAQLGLLALLALGLPILVLTTLHQTADAFVAQRLGHDADAIASVLVREGPAALSRAGWPGSRYHLLPGDRPRPPDLPWLGSPYRQLPSVRPGGPWLRQPPGGRAYRATASDGRVLAQGGRVALLPRLPLLRQEAHYERVGRMDVYRRRFSYAGGSGEIEVVQDRSYPEMIVDDVVASFLRRILWIIPIILAASTAVGLLVVRRVTRQLRKASVEADAILPASLDARLDVSALPWEVRGLASAANSALDRVAAGYRRQGQFVGSIAHELRTPMALLALRADALPPSAERDRLHEAIDQASHVVSQLMELAKLENQSPAIEPIDLAAAAREAVETAAPLVYRSGRSIGMSGPDGPQLAPGNAGLIRIALANIIDNAMRHTPQGTHISVSVEPEAIRVSDDGPGIVASEDGSFRTLGSARTDSAGLGLSIVQRIMSAMGGRLEILPAAQGARVMLRLEGLQPV